MTRYAIYGVPGVDPGAPAEAVALRRAVADWYADHPAITRDPRRYGFHATLKAPFELAPGRAVEELEAELTAFAGQRHPVLLRQLGPTAIGSFRALVPAGDTTEIDKLAADVVRSFEPFRAPLSEADVARRRPGRLTPRQRELLGEYGYPYVLDEFLVHLTLTDALGGAGDHDRELDDAIARHFAPHAGRVIPLTALSLFVEPERGAPFRIHTIHPFQEAA